MQDYTALRYATSTLQLSDPAVTNTKYKFMDSPYAFKMCRIAPENNIEMILKAFVQSPQHQLVIAGNWGKSEYGKNLRNNYNIFPNIHMLDPIYNQNELDMLRSNSFAYIHGNHPGGIDAALLEAMFMGLPVLALTTTGNKITTEGKALYFSSADDLAYMLNHTRIGEFKQVGLDMYETAHRRYTWELIATKYQYLFTRILQKHVGNQLKHQSNLKLNALHFDMGY
jgi:glycosyltransferase involved in cell wall biosynthesis